MKLDHYSQGRNSLFALGIIRAYTDQQKGRGTEKPEQESTIFSLNLALICKFAPHNPMMPVIPTLDNSGTRGENGVIIFTVISV